ncbi:uncharacterized protein LOC108477325 [Gossypium arboreum]|uniref:uncharacterized protein LOC108477325 n=1 Tax=Gossypium arboreum TaxID=29729 RepID=UPI0008190E01|nr:uncharacterized protein LOC108477325 [Gossypium arboreum]
MTQKELNLRQRRWLELIKDYDLIIDYHMGKENIVADALSKKSLFALGAMKTQLSMANDGYILAELRARLMFLQEIYEAQKGEKELEAKITQNKIDCESDFQISTNGCIMFKNRVCVPKDNEVIQRIL